MTGIPLIIAFVLTIVVMIVAISKFKVHPFLAIMAVSVVLALIAGIPITDVKNVDGTTISGIPTVIGAGFSGTFNSIGIVIILGALIGSILENTGAALKLADIVIHLVGKQHPELAMELMGWVVSIPVFCDSGFVILNPIRNALVKRTATSSVAMTVALSAGLYISHVFIPPPPAPLPPPILLGWATICCWSWASARWLRYSPLSRVSSTPGLLGTRSKALMKRVRPTSPRPTSNWWLSTAGCQAV